MQQLSSVRWVGALLVLLMSQWATAEITATEAEPLVQAMNEHELNMFAVAGRFHMLTIQEGANDVFDELRVALASYQGSASQLPSSVNDVTIDAELAVLTQLSDKFLELAQSNNIRDDGYTNANLSSDLDRTRIEMRTKFAEIRAMVADRVPDGNYTDEFYMQAVLMHQISVKYLAIAASQDGGSSIYRGNDEKDGTVSDLAQLFDETLNVLIQRHQGDPQISKALASAARKWNFIKGSFRNYLENSVPFIASRYSERIVSNLLSASKMQAGDATG